MKREKLFSFRKGYEEIDDALKLERLDDRGRNRLWSTVYKHLSDGERHTNNVDPIKRLAFEEFWCTHLANPRDRLEFVWQDNVKFLRNWCERAVWYDVFNLLEILAQYLGARTSSRFVNECNAVFEEENYGYRFVDDKISLITDESEIDEIEEAVSQPFDGVREHLRQAVSLLSNREAPDYRNVIKESISAVESLCMIITGDHGATLGQALNEIERSGNVDVHGALTSAFKKLYGYTSDTSGIRHAMLDEGSLNHEDAKYMLVICSAFVNYLTEKARKADIDFSANA